MQFPKMLCPTIYVRQMVDKSQNLKYIKYKILANGLQNKLQ